MKIIPLVDVRSNGLFQLAQTYPDQAKDLIQASRNSFGLLSSLATRLIFPHTDKISKKWLRDTNNPYFDEINNYVDLLKLPGIYTLSICLEWGCTSSVYIKEGTPTLVRALDWIFPKLGEAIIVAQQTGRTGDFYNVTWPGVSGMFNGMAPGRFAATLNQAPMQRHRLTYFGDWLANRRQVFKATGLPPAHALRQVFEQAEDYDAAKALLCKIPLALPVIYVLSGVRPGAGCVIERTENDYAIRAIEHDRVCASNQFDTKLDSTGYGWRPRPINSAGRVALARKMDLAMIDGQFSWLKPPIANSHTRLALRACAATSTLEVIGLHGEQRVTEIFKLPTGAHSCDSPARGPQ